MDAGSSRAERGRGGRGDRGGRGGGWRGRGRGYERGGRERVEHRIAYAAREGAENESSGNDDNRSRNRDFSKVQFGYMQLKEMKEKEPSDILLTFTAQRAKFKNTVANESLKSDLIVLFVNCLAKICDATYDDSKLEILMLVCRSPFLNCLRNYFLVLPYVTMNEKWNNRLYWDNMEDFWNNIVKFYNTVMDLSPNTAYECFIKLFDVNKLCVEGLKDHQKTRFSEQFLNLFDDVQFEMTVIVDDITTKKKTLLADRKPVHEADEVPDDYKSIAILPSVKELTCKSFPFLRPNIVDGEYASANHYLDVQFRLMREDYISPMRESIRSFRKDPNQRRYNGGRFYKNVKFSHYTVSTSSIGAVLKFSTQKIKPRVVSRRFLFGSLLCFTEDNFESIFFGTIVERKDDLLLQGKVVVDLMDENLNEEIFKKSFTMFESDVFYLQYGPVLEILKKFDNSVPMERYVIKMKESENPPLYARDIPKLEELIKDEQSNLDKFQYNAFVNALTSEFATIQGPPGTGKTYLGLKIASTILETVSRSELPILILCYTNHALDQFLEGLTNTTQKIVRIGGQSKNEKLATTYNLQRYRKESLGDVKNVYRDDLFEVVHSMKYFQNIYEALESDKLILDVVHFERFIPNFEVHEMKMKEIFSSMNKESYLVNWLLMSDDIDYLFNYKRVNEYFPDSTDDDADSDYEDPVPKRDQNDFLNMEDFFDEKNFNSVKKDFEIERIESSLEYFLKESQKSDLDPKKQIYYDYQTKLASAEIRFMKDILQNDDVPDNFDLESLDLVSLPANLRWTVYHYWKLQLKEIILLKMNECQKEYRKVRNLFDEANLMRDTQILRDADVVGVTTTGAARLRSLITLLSPKIVIVEEAAEVLESHIIVNLTTHCQHLILIGDHQQLRPTTASYLIGRKFNLDISLFERMFKNNKNCHRLAVQHRMRPEISKLITPSIYAELEDHESVKDYPSIRGVSKSLYFVKHSYNEGTDEVINSYKNEHEAEFLLSLAKYLILQGYKPNEITILMPYSGQLFCLQKIRKTEEMLKDVRLNILDNFQGEENKIILLSLVRSNNENKVGFLNTPNRICVALSRAREGFFLIGNMDILEEASELWKTIHATLLQQESIGHSLPLKCQIHETITEVSSSEDFITKVPEGGCQLQCTKLLSCAHICRSVCHIDHDDHKAYNCRRNCERFCVLNHKCSLLCYQTCKCTVLVEKELPCCHSKVVLCHTDPKDVVCAVNVEIILRRCSHKAITSCHNARNYPSDVIPCPEPCINRLPCGHSCKINCHVNNDPEHLDYKCMEQCAENFKGCTQNHKCLKLCHEDCDTCVFKIKKKRSNCKHTELVECHVNIDTEPCRQNCPKLLSCGHACKKKCGEICGDCKVPVKKLSSCGHEVTGPCGDDVNSIECYGRCNLKLKCGHQCRDKCGKKCGEKSCTEKVDNPFQTICGHKFQIPCYLTEESSWNNRLVLAKYCEEPCLTILKECEHLCAGNCGSCRGRLHVPCGASCGNLLICGHDCSDPCREGCSSCMKKCAMRCVHSACPLKCGVPCVPCKQPCTRKCPHGKCTMKCGEICNIQPCQERCPKKLACGHGCISMCGEKCPMICSICEPEKLPEDIFLVDYDKNTRFIYLIDCDHIVEVGSLDQWVQNSSDSERISYPTCPYCKTSIINTPRYSNIAKKTSKEIHDTKMRSFGTKDENLSLIVTISQTIEILRNHKAFSLLMTAPLWKKLVNDFGKLSTSFEKNMKKKGKTLPANRVEIQTLNSKLNVLKELADQLTRNDISMITESVLEQINFILKAIDIGGRKFSQQQVDDFQSELLRMAYLLKLVKAKSLYPNIFSVIKDEIEKIVNVVIFSNSPFTENNADDLDKIFANFSSDEAVVRAERNMIVKAMGFKLGHWFKCKNGHIYCITECGGALEISTCPDCKTEIGGTRNRVLPSNSLAPEMDGASHPAYSEIANQIYLIQNNLID